MFTWIAMQKRPIPLVVGILSVVAAFNILTLLFVALVERRTTIATLRLIGMQRKHLIMLVSAYGLGVATIGFALGVTIALVFSIVQRSLGVVRLDSAVYFIDRLPIELLPWHIISVGIAVLVLTLAVLVLPALVATRISPLAIIRIR
jgi:lipoprotein-releasing system permease protein